MNMVLKHFIGKAQLRCLQLACKGDEGGYFMQLILALQSRIVSMCQIFETSGQEDPVVMLHYFKDGSDWYIIERDMHLDEQFMAYGYACLNGNTEMAEMGFICIGELISLGVEIDLYFEPTKLRHIIQSVQSRNTEILSEAA